MRKTIDHAWGEGQSIAFFAPSVKNIPAARQFFAKLERMSASPRMARKAWDWMWELDVRPVARALRVPTLVPHRTGDHAILVSNSHWLARNIPGARLFEQPEIDHAPWRSNVVSDLIEEVRHFLTGSRGPVERDRFWRLSFSPTSSARLKKPPRSETTTGAIFSIIITLSSVVTSRASRR